MWLLILRLHFRKAYAVVCKHNMIAAAFIVLSALLGAAAVDPLVTLKHGGKLRGKRFDYDGVGIELFLGKLSLPKYEKFRG